MGISRRRARALVRPRAGSVGSGRTPSWWGDRIAEGHRLVELAGPPSCGKLSLALLWLASLYDRGRIAVIDLAGTFYPPAAAGAGIDLDRVVVVRPPGPREAVEVVMALVGAVGFDAVLWPLTRRTSPHPTAAAKLHMLAGRAHTRVVTLLERPHRAEGWGLVSADVRLAVTQHAWRFADGELGGVDLVVRTERARGLVVPDWSFSLDGTGQPVKISASGAKDSGRLGVDSTSANQAIMG